MSTTPRFMQPTKAAVRREEQVMEDHETKMEHLKRGNTLTPRKVPVIPKPSIDKSSATPTLPSPKSQRGQIKPREPLFVPASERRVSSSSTQSPRTPRSVRQKSPTTLSPSPPLRKTRKEGEADTEALTKEQEPLDQVDKSNHEEQSGSLMIIETANLQDNDREEENSHESTLQSEYIPAEVPEETILEEVTAETGDEEAKSDDGVCELQVSNDENHEEAIQDIVDHEWSGNGGGETKFNQVVEQPEGESEEKSEEKDVEEDGDNFRQFEGSETQKTTKSDGPTLHDFRLSDKSIISSFADSFADEIISTYLQSLQRSERKSVRFE